eukprot:m.133720 g.133720  ORF g.133720 m.133720 type:complete len:56 (-) comp11361_c0_seq3:96-263(-)
MAFEKLFKAVKQFCELLWALVWCNPLPSFVSICYQLSVLFAPKATHTWHASSFEY